MSQYYLIVQKSMVNLITVVGGREFSVLYSENPLHVVNSSVCRMLKSSVVFGFEIQSGTRMDFELRICLSVVYLAAVFE
jgi:hypothetical protein